MTDVFVAYSAYYEDWGIIGVFDSFEKAQDAIKKADIRIGRITIIEQYRVNGTEPLKDWRFERDGVTPERDSV